MLNSDFKDDLEFPKVAPAAEDLIKHSFNQGGSLGFSSGGEEMAPKVRALGKKKAMEAELNHPTLDPILVLPSPATEVQSSASSSSKRKRKLLIEGPSRPKRGRGGVQRQANHARHSNPLTSCSELRMLEKVLHRAEEACNESKAALAQMNKALQENAELKNVAYKEVF
ncbi:hypothetical protein Acr_17g0007700 [Actinidia rufa]|uniref:Uncharacterized protein n=1 Tax=Actinidia rufa TaxID=165716 RepID=A0A7J0G356_9ERIC|nr:hypothetical protein Acr_17g0007700 [Actinidia rufa]